MLYAFLDYIILFHDNQIIIYIVYNNFRHTKPIKTLGKYTPFY